MDWRGDLRVEWRRMESGEWRMKSGPWRVGWKVDGVRMENGERRVECGVWRVESGIFVMSSAYRVVRDALNLHE